MTRNDRIADNPSSTDSISNESKIDSTWHLDHHNNSSGGLHSHWSFLLNAPPKAFISGADIPLQELPSNTWLADELSSHYVDTTLALSLCLPEHPCARFNSPISPLQQMQRGGVSVKGHPFPEETALQRYIDYLTKEVHLLGKILNNKTSLTYVHWSAQMLCHLSNSALTQLTFHINKTFPEFALGRTKVVAELNQPLRHESQLALLAGLGIKAICINDPGTSHNGFHLNELAYWLRLIRSYGLSEVFLRLTLTPEVVRKITGHMRDILSPTPTVILLIPYYYAEPKTQEHKDQDMAIDNIRKQLIQYGFRPVTDCLFVSSHHYSSNACQLLIGLGLGAHSFTHSVEWVNTSNLADYYQHLDQKHLPIARARKVLAELY